MCPQPQHLEQHTHTPRCPLLSTMFVDAGTETKLTKQRRLQPLKGRSSLASSRSLNRIYDRATSQTLRAPVSPSLSLSLFRQSQRKISEIVSALNGQRNVRPSQVLSRRGLDTARPVCLSVWVSVGLCLPRNRAWCQCRDFIAINFSFRPVYASCVRLTRPTAAAVAGTFAAFRICISCPLPLALPCCCCAVTRRLQPQLPRGTP